MREKFFTTKNITVAAMLTAISFVLYMFVKFPLPFIFPEFLDVQFSELPAMIAGFMMGPIWGGIVILLKCLLKMPFTSTACVGEIGDLLMGIAYVVPAAVIYKRTRSKKGAVIGLIAGTVSEIAVAMFVNGLLLIPFYAKAFGWEAIVGMLSKLFPGVTQKTVYRFYLPLSVLPFNLLRLSVCSLITFFVYKHLHKLIDKMFAPRKRDDIETNAAGCPEAEIAGAEVASCQNAEDAASDKSDGNY